MRSSYPHELQSGKNMLKTNTTDKSWFGLTNEINCFVCTAFYDLSDWSVE